MASAQKFIKDSRKKIPKFRVIFSGTSGFFSLAGIFRSLRRDWLCPFVHVLLRWLLDVLQSVKMPIARPDFHSSEVKEVYGEDCYALPQRPLVLFQ